jgi:SAM-dependent methyltransferase
MKLWIPPLAALVPPGLELLTCPRHLALRLTTIRMTGMPSAGAYDLLVGWPFSGLYERVARAVAVAYSSGSVLEVGSGPGRLAARLARLAPGLAITGLDLDPGMVRLARRRAAGAGVAARVRFVLGDVAALPFPDARFGLVFSTASMHHWEDAARGLAEVHRVLAPGGEAWIYDLAGRAFGHAPGRSGLEQVATASPFGGGVLEPFAWPGPLRLLSWMRLRRPSAADS